MQMAVASAGRSTLPGFRLRLHPGYELLERALPEHAAVRLLGVTVSNLEPRDVHQPALCG